MDHMATSQNVSLEAAYTAVVSDVLDRLGFRQQVVDSEIVPMYPGAVVAGRAMPVRVEATLVQSDNPYEGDMRMMEALKPGDVPVVLGESGSTLGRVDLVCGTGKGSERSDRFWLFTR